MTLFPWAQKIQGWLVQREEAPIRLIVTQWFTWCFDKVGFKLSSAFSQIWACFLTHLCSVQNTTCSSWILKANGALLNFLRGEDPQMDSVQLFPQALTQVSIQGICGQIHYAPCYRLGCFPTHLSARSFSDLHSEKPNTWCWLLLRQPLWFLSLAYPASSWMLLTLLQKTTTIFKIVKIAQHSFCFFSIYWPATCACSTASSRAGKTSSRLYLGLAERGKDRQQMAIMTAWYVFHGTLSALVSVYLRLLRFCEEGSKSFQFRKPQVRHGSI